MTYYYANFSYEYIHAHKTTCILSIGQGFVFRLDSWEKKQEVEG